MIRQNTNPKKKGLKHLCIRNQNQRGGSKFFLIRVLQGVVIGLGAVLPGISGGVLGVIFGIYKPIMELLSHPVKNFKTHVPPLIPVILGGIIGFLGVANILAFFLEKYPDPSVCVFIGLITGMLPSLFREANEKGRRKGAFIPMFACMAAIFAILIGLQMTAIQVEPNFLWVPVFRFLPGAQRHCPRYELFHAADAPGTVYPVCGRHRPC